MCRSLSGLTSLDILQNREALNYCAGAVVPSYTESMSSLGSLPVPRDPLTMTDCICNIFTT
jgi:hypothetical protein